MWASTRDSMRGLFGNQKSGNQEGKSTRAGHTLQPFCRAFLISGFQIERVRRFQGKDFRVKDFRKISGSDLKDFRVKDFRDFRVTGISGSRDFRVRPRI